MGPGLSWLALMGTTPPVGTAPTVGLSPTTPLTDAGQTMEPSVSVPTARGTSPAATAAPDPDDEPPALRSSAHGFPTSPPVADHPLVERSERMLAHSDRLVLPEHDGPGLAQPGDQRRVGGRAAEQCGRAGGAGQPGHLDVVLDHDRHAVERTA